MPSAGTDLMAGADLMAGGGGELNLSPNYSGEVAKDGYECVEKFPLGGGFWTQDPKGGLA
jgi:hypothetical protein